MTKILAERAAEKRAAGEALIREADGLACQSWNERMWADGGPIDPSPTIDQAINGATPGSRSSAPAARRHAASISRPCPTPPPHASTTSPAGCAALSAPRPESARRPNCISWRRAGGTFPERRHDDADAPP
jgi:hypothetical protein